MINLSRTGGRGGAVVEVGLWPLNSWAGGGGGVLPS